MMDVNHEPYVHKIEINVPHRMGFQLRLVVQFSKCMQVFKSNIRIRKGKMLADGKNVMEILILAAAWKSKLQIEVAGEDAEKAVEGVREFFIKRNDTKPSCF